MAKKIKKEVEEELLDEEELDEDEKEDEIEEEENDYEDLSLEDRIINIEKKSNITLFISLITCLLCVILLFGMFNGSNNEEQAELSNNEAQESNYSYDTSAMKEIAVSDIKSESKKETIVIVVGRQGCSACAAYMPILTSVAAEYNTTIRYIDIAKIVKFTDTGNYVDDKESFDALTALTGSGEWKTFVSDYIQYTPLTIIVKNNKVVGGVSGALEADGIRTMFDAAGLKK